MNSTSESLKNMALSMKATGGKQVNSIKAEREEIFTQIDKWKERLKVLQERCGHANTEQMMREERVGRIFPAIVCSDCGKYIKSVVSSENGVPTWNCRSGSGEVVYAKPFESQR